MTDLIVPGLLLLAALGTLRRGEDMYAALTGGIREGFSLLLTLVPALIALLTAVEMLRASGALEALTALLGPVCRRIGLPPEVLPLALIRPLSGSGALAVGAEIMGTYGPDSLVGRTAAVMLGSTETTFYALGVYFGACGIRRSRYTLVAALAADLTGFLAAAAVVRLFWG